MKREKPLTLQQKQQGIGLAIADHQLAKFRCLDAKDFDAALGHTEAIQALRRLQGRMIGESHVGG